MSEQFDLDLSLEAQTSIAEWVFTQTLEDLKRRVTDPALGSDRYQVLGIAPLLRKLLIDGSSLVNKVNRRQRLKLSFNIVPFEKDDVECLEMVQRVYPGDNRPLEALPYWRIFLPGSLVPSPGHVGNSLELPHFLRANVGVVSRIRVTVKELIQFYCIVEAGVHIGDARNKLEKNLLVTVPHELDAPQFGIASSPIGTLIPIAEIVIKSLTPLAEAVQSNPSPVRKDYGFTSAFWGGPFSGGWVSSEMNRKS